MKVSAKFVYLQESSSTSDDDRPSFPGSRSSWTEKLEFVQPDIYDGIPVYRVMDTKGKVIAPDQDPNVSEQSYFTAHYHFISVSEFSKGSIIMFFFFNQHFSMQIPNLQSVSGSHM